MNSFILENISSTDSNKLKICLNNSWTHIKTEEGNLSAYLTEKRKWLINILSQQ